MTNENIRGEIELTFSDLVLLVRKEFSNERDNIGYARAAQIVDKAIEPQGKDAQSKAYDELLDKLPNYRKDTRGATQNPDKVTYHTKTAKGFNECLDQVVAIINLAKERLS